MAPLHWEFPHPLSLFQQFTSTVNDSVSLNFTSGGIAVFGSIQSTHGLYTVTVDGTSQTLNGTNPFLAVPVLIYFQAGLESNEQHIITIANAGPDGNFLDIDSFTLLECVYRFSLHF
jgi:hypothetical protein